MKLNLIKLLPIFLLAGCTATYQPAQTSDVIELTSSAPAVAAATVDNCLVGCPTGGSSQTEIREAYTLNNNASTKFANWVAYKITKTSQASNRPRNWKQDPAFPPTDTLAPSAYDGANAALAVDRGHQAPLAGLGGTSDWEALNYLSNITPQKAALNQGAWVRLEDKERALANSAGVSAVYSVTGPLFEKNIATLPSAPTVQIPSGYWKVIFIGSSPDKGEYVAFLMNQDTLKSSDFCSYQVTVDSIEQKTNPKLSIWSALPANIAAIVKSQKGTLAKNKFGCP
ncbi:DNA/RNA non-specific endonuclease [Pectobacterium carotovorum]|uniref:DNA/RNA non-specific endonuclease n=1 Tax=Pectobacterium carotovorum TaxID=554 RepID=UPI00057D5C2D|nr:DNA/RNA non-specific endonuclease [Pectobacterium carotovorum]KHT34409.1 endonuclease [Pectobacterium carotovorum subsp. carotovorum]